MVLATICTEPAAILKLRRRKLKVRSPTTLSHTSSLPFTNRHACTADAHKLSSKVQSELNTGKASQEAKDEAKSTGKDIQAKADKALSDAKSQANQASSDIHKQAEKAKQEAEKYRKEAGTELNKAVDTFDKKVTEVSD